MRRYAFRCFKKRFILAFVLIWLLVTVVAACNYPKDNELVNLGFLCTMNQSFENRKAIRFLLLFADGFAIMDEH